MGFRYMSQCELSPLCRTCTVNNIVIIVFKNNNSLRNNSFNTYYIATPKSYRFLL